MLSAKDQEAANNTRTRRLGRTSLDTVLLVEDEVLIRLSIAEYLRHCGYRVLEAANADEGLAILQKADAQVDVVLSDIEMPGSINGFRLAQWVRPTVRASTLCWWAPHNGQPVLLLSFASLARL